MLGVEYRAGYTFELKGLRRANKINLDVNGLNEFAILFCSKSCVCVALQTMTDVLIVIIVYSLKHIKINCTLFTSYYLISFDTVLGKQLFELTFSYHIPLSLQNTNIYHLHTETDFTVEKFGIKNHNSTRNFYICILWYTVGA